MVTAPVADTSTTSRGARPTAASPGNVSIVVVDGHSCDGLTGSVTVCNFLKFNFAEVFMNQARGRSDA